ncbi:hypothetical protein [Micromonospora maris]|uniref:hypothetical protein n=1 Tax=Micromonospora maris TaxID=1003110 RepID=UPI002E11E1B6|nr:hypothetical protein OG712_05630 [Micromonospora maris]
MPSLAFTRPLWSVTRCPLADLTRLALTALILAVGLGGITATGLPDGTADLPAAPPAAALPNRPGDAPATARALWPGNNQSTLTLASTRTRPRNDESTLTSSWNASALTSSWNASALTSSWNASALTSSWNASALISSWNASALFSRDESALVSPVSVVHAAAVVPHSEHTDAGAVRASARPAAVRLAAGPGEPTRRGPPTA